MPPKNRPRPPQRFVYVIGPTSGLQKIGLATDPQARLAALKTASPFPLALHAAVAVPFGEAHAVEARAHTALASSRGAGEWFNVTPAEAIAAVKVAARQEGLGAPLAGERSDIVALPLFAYAPSPASSLPSGGKAEPGRAWQRVYRRVVQRLSDAPG